MRRNRGRQTQRTARPDQAGAVLRDAGRCRNPGRVCGIILELRAGLVGGARSGRLRQARRGALRLAAHQDRRRLRRRLAARHRCRSHRIGPHGARPRHPDLPQPDEGLGRGRLCLSAAVGRRGRYAEDGDRRSRRGRRHQGAAAGQDHLRTGEAERAEGGADRTGAAEHLHQLGRQYRPRRNRAGADRISGACRTIRQRVLAAGADGGRPALQSRTRRAERRLPRRRRRLGFGQIRSRAGPRPHLARRARPRDERAGQSDPHHRAAAGRLPARRDQEPPSRDQDRKA